MKYLWAHCYGAHIPRFDSVTRTFVPDLKTILDAMVQHEQLAAENREIHRALDVAGPEFMVGHVNFYRKCLS